MTTIVLDGRHILDHFPGIGRYVFNLGLGLGQVADEERIRLLLNSREPNTRFDLSTLEAAPNVALVRVAPATRSFGEQLLGFDKRLIDGASLWHSAYYVMPYWLPIPAVLTLEDVVPLVVHETMPRPLSRLLYRSLVMLGARRAVHVITLSQAAAQDIRRVLTVPSNKITVVPLAADSVFFPRTTAEITRVRATLGLPERYALYVGSNKPHKNLERLVQAWALADTDAALVIAGYSDARYPGAKRLAESAGLSDRVLFREKVANDDLPPLMSGAQVFAFPSIYEGFGLPPLEAMAAGTPVVCSNTSSLPEVVGDAAKLFDPFDTRDIASRLSLVLSDSALRDFLRAKGLARAAQFSWQQTARETLAVYNRILGESARETGLWRNSGG